MFVASQPQFKLAIPLIFTSWVLGSLINSFFSGPTLQNYLEDAKSSLPPGIEISHSSGMISLANGWAPEFSLVLKNVNIKISSTCLVNPEIQISTIRIPLLGLIGNNPSWSLSLGETVLTLRSPFENCFNQQVISKIQETSGYTVGHSVGSTGSLEASGKLLEAKSRSEGTQAEGRLKKIFIERLIVHDFSRSQPIIGLEWKFLNWQRVGSTDDWNANFQFQIPGSIFGAGSGLRVIADVGSIDSAIELKAKGFWREGLFEFVTLGDLGKKEFKSEFELTDISVEELLSALRHLKYVSFPEFDLGKNWLSAKGSFNVIGSDLNLIVDEFGIQGDLGSLELLNPVNFSPEFNLLKNQELTLILKEFSLEFLSQIIPNPSVIRSFRDFGQLNGKLSLLDQQLDFKGTLNKVAFIFSNFGTRADQIINSCNLNVSHDNNTSRVLLSDCSIEGGQWVGGLSGEFRKQNDYDLSLEFSDLSLSSRVQRVLTGGGFLGPMAGKIEVTKTEAHQKSEGFLSLNSSVLAKTEIEKVRLEFLESQSQLNIKIDGVGVFDGSLSYLNFLRNPLLLGDSKLKSEFRGDLVSKGSRAWSWTELVIRNQEWNLTSSGGFDQFERVFGALEFKRSVEPNSTRFQLVGSRSNPRIEVQLK